MCFQHTFSFGLEKSRLNTVKLTVQTFNFPIEEQQTLYKRITIVDKNF